MYKWKEAKAGVLGADLSANAAFEPLRLLRMYRSFADKSAPTKTFLVGEYALLDKKRLAGNSFSSVADKALGETHCRRAASHVGVAERQRYVEHAVGPFTNHVLQ